MIWKCGANLGLILFKSFALIWIWCCTLASSGLSPRLIAGSQGVSYEYIVGLISNLIIKILYSKITSFKVNPCVIKLTPLFLIPPPFPQRGEGGIREGGLGRGD